MALNSKTICSRNYQYVYIQLLFNFETDMKKGEMTTAFLQNEEMPNQFEVVDQVNFGYQTRKQLSAIDCASLLIGRLHAYLLTQS